ncbi:MAG: hypothetical protein MH204_06510, partial [Fimbriimonadaceae bacterium]|nr:hypothetical protein [Fimbriimonadaceae bacterium]
SPVGFALDLRGSRLFEPQRRTSFCTGASYAALIGALDRLLPAGLEIPASAAESLAQREADGGRREDQVGFWGVWNGSGAGQVNALTRLTLAGDRVRPQEYRPGDFVQIFWNNGYGHSVVFLGWRVSGGTKRMRYWSSQKGTNGLGDQEVPVSRIRTVHGVRLTRPLEILAAPSGFFVYSMDPGDRPWSP